VPQSTEQPLRKTPLHALHLELGARMTPFAGYEMPLQYKLGVLKEHLATRASCGLFDVSHMGQVVLRHRSGGVAETALALERLLPVDLLGLAPGRQRYGLFTTSTGGILDDLMVANRGDHLHLVVNASRKGVDTAHLAANLADTSHVTPLADRALIALQGPMAETVLARLAPQVATLRFMDVADVVLLGTNCLVSRSGYTGEDGFEISIANTDAEMIARALLDDPAVTPVGLGARDSLRVEAGLCLYGSDIDDTTTPVEAGLAWAIQPVRRAAGARAGGFPGAPTILRQLAEGAPSQRVGLKSDRVPVRSGTPLFTQNSGGEPIGRVTSGVFGPSIEAPVAMGYVPPTAARPGTQLFAEVRGKRQPVVVTHMPFVPARYKRVAS
jgi:aminomethyltransferase